jgi:hypothetical protein
MQYAPPSLPPLLVFVIGDEVEMGDANGNDDMSGDGVPMARKDLVAEGIRIAV